MSTVRSALRLPPRARLAAAITVAVLAVAVAAGTAGSSVIWGPLVFAESVSAMISGAVFALGTKVPFGYAFVAGMVASVNPCGFVLLPAYLGLYLGESQDGGRRGRRAGRALLVSAVVTGSFVLLFGAAGTLAGLAASAVAAALPWIGVAIGAGLVLLGGYLATGRELAMPWGPRAAQRFRDATMTAGIGGYAAYGMAYGLASLGCTLPVFLGVVGTSFALHGVAAATGQFVLFGLGMGAVLAFLTMTTALAGGGLLTRLRGLGRHVGWVSAVILWLAGAYVVYYWLTAIRLI
jgi:cytochrome c-type biogenesis protein